MVSVPAGTPRTDSFSSLSQAENRNQALVLANFEDPACTAVESESTRLRVSSETVDSLRQLHLQAKLSSLPNLPSAFRRETLLHLLRQHHSAVAVLQLLLDAMETRSLWRIEAAKYSFDRIRDKYTSGCIRQQGRDKQGRPIVWILRPRERSEWRTALFQEEFARSLLWAVDVAIRRRPNGVHGVVIYVVDQPGTGALSFGSTFAALLCREHPATLGLLEHIYFFNPTSSSLVLKNLLRHYSQKKLSMKSVFQQLQSEMWREWVDRIGDVPLLKATETKHGDAEGRSALLCEALKSHFGFSPPMCLENVFNAEPKEVERWYRLQRKVAAAQLISMPDSLEPDSDRSTTNVERGVLSTPRDLRLNALLALDCAVEWNPSPRSSFLIRGPTSGGRPTSGVRSAGRSGKKSVGSDLGVIDECLPAFEEE